VAQLARLGDGTCVVNFHASSRVGLAEDELERLWQRALAFARDAPLILGGDLNLRSPAAPPRVAHLARRDVDHIFARGVKPCAGAELLDRHVCIDGQRVELSDHVPLLVRAHPERCIGR
jgi:endonuclease/exonuclease/phosphatase (EEP) superfamily protein YafD